MKMWALSESINFKVVPAERWVKCGVLYYCTGLQDTVGYTETLLGII